MAAVRSTANFAPGSSFPDSVPQAAPSRIGKYSVQKELGRGGFGAVYLAWDDVLARHVAIKVPHRHRVPTADARSQFLNEGRIAARLRHPGIVMVFEAGLEQESCYIVYEFVEGETLDEWCRRTRPNDRNLARVMLALCDALSAAHASLLTHRDLKPQNVLIDREGNPRIADFGLGIDESIRRGARGDVVGTPQYMSPEQVRGESHRLDGRTDLWSLGVIFYQLWSGRLPFDGESHDELFDEILYREPRPMRQADPRIDRRLDDIVLKCLEKDVTRRYASARETAEDLRQWLSARESSSPPVPVAVPLPANASPSSRIEAPSAGTVAKQVGRGRVGAVFAVVVLVCVALAGLKFLPRNQKPDNPPAPPVFPAVSSISNAVEPAVSPPVPLSFRSLGPTEQKTHTWYPLLTSRDYHRPVWTQDDQASEVTSQSESETLILTSRNWGLVELGTVDVREFTLKVELTQVPWHGECGVFFGLKRRPIDGAEVTEFETLKLVNAKTPQGDDEFQLRRYHVEMTASPGGAPEVRTMAIAAETLAHPGLTSHWLEVSVRGGRVAAARWDGLPLSQLAQPQDVASVSEDESSFGVFASGSSVTFRRGQILLVEARRH